jgi:hypothetical protein
MHSTKSSTTFSPAALMPAEPLAAAVEHLGHLLDLDLRDLQRGELAPGPRHDHSGDEWPHSDGAFVVPRRSPYLSVLVPEIGSSARSYAQRRFTLAVLDDLGRCTGSDGERRPGHLLPSGFDPAGRVFDSPVRVLAVAPLCATSCAAADSAGSTRSSALGGASTPRGGASAVPAITRSDVRAIARRRASRTTAR